MEIRKHIEKDFFDNIKLKKNILFNLTQKWYIWDQEIKEYLNNLFKQEFLDKVVLDYCCGEGETSFKIAQWGAREVIGVDVSEVLIEKAKIKSLRKDPNKKCKFFVMDAEKLEFPDNYFDLIYENAALHHLDLDLAYQQLKRVLKPKGKIICIEPLKYNPLIRMYRRFTPHLRTEWERRHILGREEINLAKRYFKKIEFLSFFHLISILSIIFLETSFFVYVKKSLNTLDRFILKLPGIRWLGWQVVFLLSEPIKE